MPTAVHEIDKSRESISDGRRSGGRRRSSRCAWSTRQLRVFVIKTGSMVVVPGGVDS